MQQLRCPEALSSTQDTASSQLEDSPRHAPAHLQPPTPLGCASILGSEAVTQEELGRHFPLTGWGWLGGFVVPWSRRGVRIERCEN